MPGTPGGPRGSDDWEHFSLGVLDKFREEAEDFLGGFEELESSPVSETAGAPVAADNKAADDLAAEPNRLAGTAQFHLAVLAGLKGEGMFDEESY